MDAVVTPPEPEGTDPEVVDAPGERLIPPKDDPGVGKAVLECFDEGWRARLPFHPTWCRSTAFFDGYQWVTWDSSAQRLAPNNMFPRGTVRVMENIIQPVVAQALSILTSAPPHMIADPASSDPEDRARADVATALLERNARDLRREDTDATVKLWKMLTSTVCVETEWQPEAGPWVPEEKRDAFGNKIPVVDKNGAPVLRPKGALVEEVYTALEQIPEPNSTSPDDAAWVIFYRIISGREASRRFPTITPKKANADGKGTVWSKAAALLQRAFSAQGMSSSAAAGDPDAVTLLKFHQAPCAEAPAGRTIVMVGDVVVHDEPSQTHGQKRYPFESFTHNKHGKRWFAPGLVEFLLELQSEVNRTLTRYGDTLHRMGNPKILLNEEAGVNRNSFTDAVAQVVRWQGESAHHKPEFMQGVTMPSSVVEYLRGRVEMMYRIAGINESTQGVLPSSDASGTAIKALQSRDVQRLATIARTDAETWARVAKYELFLQSKYMPDGEIVKVTGRDLAVFEHEFKRADLGTNNDVVVVAGEGFPRDPAAQQQFLTNWFSPGGPMQTLPPDARKQFLSTMRLGGLRTLLMESNRFEVHTMRQIQEAARGPEQPVVLYNDDHRFARMVIQRYMLSADFGDLKDDAKARVSQLDRDHAFYMQQPTDGIQPGTGITLPQGVPVPGAPPVPAAAPGGPGAAPATHQGAFDAAGLPPQPAAQGSQPRPRAAA